MPCTTPEYHDTHRYCPSCDWRQETLQERMGRNGPLVYTSNMGADAPVFHRVIERDDGVLNSLCDLDNRTVFYWAVLHVKHAARIGTACETCFPPLTVERGDGG